MNILESHIEGAQRFKPRAREQIYRAIIEYLAYGIEPDYLKDEALGYFIAIKPNLDKSYARAAAGSKGGKARKQTNGNDQASLLDSDEQNASKLTSKTQANANQSAEQNASDCDCDCECEGVSNDTPNPVAPYAVIVGYLNEQAGTTYRHTSKKTRSLINARMREGFTVDDFKIVIDAKCSEWLNDPKMSAFIRPETLFSTKFEGYLCRPRPKKEEDHGKYAD